MNIPKHHRLNIVGVVIPKSNPQEADPTSSYVTSVIMSSRPQRNTEVQQP